jgi:hypothetical protein
MKGRRDEGEKGITAEGQTTERKKGKMEKGKEGWKEGWNEGWKEGWKEGKDEEWL